MPLEYINDQSFALAVNDSKTAKVVMFYAQWCPHCHGMFALLEEAQKEYKDKIKFLVVDVETAPKAVSQCTIKAVPVFFFFRKRKKNPVVFTGSMTKQELQQHLKELV